MKIFANPTHALRDERNSFHGAFPVAVYSVVTLSQYSCGFPEADLLVGVIDLWSIKKLHSWLQI